MKIIMKVIPRPIPCAVSGCKGKIVWMKQNPISVCGLCYECQAGWTLLLTQGPTVRDQGPGIRDQGSTKN